MPPTGDALPAPDRSKRHRFARLTCQIGRRECLVASGAMAVAGMDELLRSRELTANLVRRDLKVRHRGTFLGMLWSLTTPLLLVGLYYFIFTYIFKVKTVPDAVRSDGIGRALRHLLLRRARRLEPVRQRGRRVHRQHHRVRLPAQQGVLPPGRATPEHRALVPRDVRLRAGRPPGRHPRVRRPAQRPDPLAAGDRPDRGGHVLRPGPAPVGRHRVPPRRGPLHRRVPPALVLGDARSSTRCRSCRPTARGWSVPSSSTP